MPEALIPDDPSKNVLITGAAGILGRKLRQHLSGRCSLRLLEREPRGDADVVAADLAVWSRAWAELFASVDTVFHFAADPEAYHPWPDFVAPYLDALIQVYRAAALNDVKRFVFASSKHVMGGYQDVPGIRLQAFRCGFDWEMAYRAWCREWLTIVGRAPNACVSWAGELGGERADSTFRQK